MRNRFSLLAMALAVSGTLVLAQGGRSPEALFKAAQHAEEVQGDLKGAIEQYKKVLTGANRALSAKALLRMAECHRKLGDAQSRAVYERIVREFGDQQDAVALARIRLASGGSGTASTGMVLRRVWSGRDVDNEGTVSADGRYVSVPDWETGDLAVRDLASGTTRHLTHHDTAPGTYSEFAEESALSRDNSQVAYSWFNGKDRYEMRLLSVQNSSSVAQQPRHLYDNPDVTWMAPYDWSPDGKWIAVQIQRKDHTAQIGLLSSQDGTLRVLKSVNWRGTSRIFISPDGKFLTFDLPANDSASSDREVFLLAIDGSRENRVVAAPGQNRVMGFSPDGTRLLFGSDRGGPFGLWSISVDNGRADGVPVLIKQDIAPSSIGVTKAGALFVVGRIGETDIHIASVDLRSGKVLSGPTTVANSFFGTNIQPDWSPDGRHLVFCI